MFRAFTVGAALILFYIAPAHAYLDAGSVSMALQAITATVAAGMAGIVLFWGRVKSMVFGRHNSPASGPADEDTQSKR
jgi:hypothetical protein